MSYPPIPATTYANFNGTSDYDYGGDGPWYCDRNSAKLPCDVTPQQHLDGGGGTAPFLAFNGVLAANITVDTILVPEDRNINYTWGFTACHTSNDNNGTVWSLVGGDAYQDAISLCPATSTLRRRTGSFQLGQNGAFILSIVSTPRGGGVANATMYAGSFFLELGGLRAAPTTTAHLTPITSTESMSTASRIPSITVSWPPSAISGTNESPISVPGSPADSPKGITIAAGVGGVIAGCILILIGYYWWTRRARNDDVWSRFVRPATREVVPFTIPPETALVRRLSGNPPGYYDGFH